MMSTNFRRGSALIIVIIIATCLGILSMSYFNASRESRHSEQWFEHKNIAREAATMLHEEAFASLLKDCRDQRSQIFWFLLGTVSGAQNELRLSFARQNIAKIFPEGYSCEFSSQLKVINFNNTKPDGQAYAAKNEGHGILAVITKVEIFYTRGPKKTAVAKYFLEIHHDYIVASMLGCNKSESKFKNALMIRKNREFDGQNIIRSGNTQLLTYQTDNASPTINPENIKVYNQFSLWARRGLSIEDLYRLKIIDTTTRTINLSGINHCSEAITLDGQWQIRGQGVLIADSFTINDSIKKAGSSDLAVFYARRGSIHINTSNEIHAALVAINDSYSGTVEAAKALNLNGLMLIDRLNLQTWSQDEHILVFDRAFLDCEKAYQINISRWINYRRGSETL